MLALLFSQNAIALIAVAFILLSVLTWNWRRWVAIVFTVLTVVEILLLGWTNGDVEKPAAVPPKATTWIAFSSLEGARYYIVTNNQLKSVGKPMNIYISNYHIGPFAIDSNRLKSGDLYDIPGQNWQKEFAVETSRGHYFKAVLYSESKHLTGLALLRYRFAQLMGAKTH